MKKRPYQICTNCVMDTTDSKIVFDEKGVCDFCNDYYENILPSWKQGAEGERELQEIAKKIRQAGKGKKYDCIIGMSGGVDSSYLCYVAKEIMHLRPLIYCVDTGWNLKVADENIKRIVDALGVDMYTEVVDWEEMKDLQLAFFKSQVPYQDLPQDHAIFAGLYNFAVKNKAKYINIEDLTGYDTSKFILRNWSFYELQQFITYKAAKYGIEVKKINPCYTSQVCSCCGYWEEGQRIDQAHFKCKSCGEELNADFNASRNIAKSTLWCDEKITEKHKREAREHYGIVEG